MTTATPVFNAAENEPEGHEHIGYPKVPVRVASGLRFLVEREGEHVLAVVDTTTLDMLSDTANLLAQIYGAEVHGEVALGLSTTGAIALGFNPYGTVGDELTDAWVEAIELWRGGALPVRLQGRRARHAATVADEGPEAA